MVAVGVNFEVGNLHMNQQHYLPYEHSFLVHGYFSNYLELLVTARGNATSDTEGCFAKAAFSPDALERRLQRIEHLGLTSRILAEVGEIGDPVELDRRLMDVWAELRTLDQLLREGYTDIEKVTEVADFIAVCDQQKAAFQVTHLNKRLAGNGNRQGSRETRSLSPYGEIKDIHSRLDKATKELIRRRISEKNTKFASWASNGVVRCVVLVTNEGTLQDSMQRHIVCQQIRRKIHSLATIHFDQLLWLPDDGNGAWFYVGETAAETSCWADWNDVLPSVALSQAGQSALPIERRQVDLDSDVPRWIEERN